MTRYTIRYNRSTNHISGITERSKGSELDYAVSACSTLSRNAVRLAQGESTEDLAEAVKMAQSAGQRKICKTCYKAAMVQIERDARSAAGLAVLTTDEIRSISESLFGF